MEPFLSFCVGLGLSAACGFRIFVPLLVMSIASHTGHLDLGEGFKWVGSDLALASFALATCLEVAAYYIPWVDNFLDSVATPAAIVAGTIVTASMVSDVSPYLKWTLAVIAGGGAAGLVQGATVLTRGASTITTAGLANPVVATVELGGSIFTSVLSIMAPIVAVVLVIALLGVLAWKYLPRLLRKRNGLQAP